MLLPTIQTEVRVTRAELEAMIRPPLSETVTALERAVRSAGLTPEGIDHVLLVGGSSRIPLVAELVSAGLGRPVAVDAHPKRDRPGRRHRGRPGGGGAGARRHPPTASRGHPPGPTRGRLPAPRPGPDRRRGRTAAPGGRRPRLPPSPAGPPHRRRPGRPRRAGPAWAPEQRPAPPTAAAQRSPAPPPAGSPYGGGQHDPGQQPP